MKLLKENQTEEYEDHAWEVGDVGVRLTCVAKVSYVKFIISDLSLTQMSYSFKCLLL